MSVSPNKDNCSPFSSSFKMNQDTVKNNQNPKPGGSGSYAGKHYTPSPSTQPKNRLSDRFIPCRSSANLYHKFMAQDSEPENIMKGSQNMNVSSSSSNYSQLLHNQIFCNENANNEEVTKILGSCEQIENGLINQSVPNWPKKIFKFKHELRKSEGYLPSRQTIGGMINYDRQQLLNPSKQARKIGKLPFKVLDAPQLQDDFYLNLVDWSAMNVLAVGLGSTVYIWSAYTSKVSKLCDVEEESNSISSVAWNGRGSQLAVGTHNGMTQIWDTARLKMVREMDGHSARVSSAGWNDGNILSTGSRDRSILVRDIRAPEPYYSKLLGHKQEVCGMKWSFDGQQLATGGNDNNLYIWGNHSNAPLARFPDHQAAVKALAWSPHQHGVLASGGGTADRCIRFWNTQTLSPLKFYDTGSQVCNLVWSKTVNELVSTHGYSLNQIIVWKYPDMSKVATLTGHTYRVLYLSMSPDGQSIVTGAGDETLRFWNVFPPFQNKSSNIFGCSSNLIPSSMEVR